MTTKAARPARPVPLRKLPPETYALVAVLDQVVRELERIGDAMDRLAPEPATTPQDAAGSHETAPAVRKHRRTRPEPPRTLLAPASTTATTREERTA